MQRQKNLLKSLVIITGMSGSGKQTAYKSFEDMGYFCVDNLPTALVPRLVHLALASGGKITNLALVVDSRSGETPAEFTELFGRLKEFAFSCSVLFLEATDEVIARRYSETRRMHPMARSTSLIEGIQKERQELSSLRDMADVIIETSRFGVHELRKALQERYGMENRVSGINLSLISFGYKNGIPFNADLVFDVRFLPNPFFVEELKSRTGEDSEVVGYMMNFPETSEIIGRILEMLLYLLPRFAREGKSYCTVAVGCTGGRHRSVMVLNELRLRLVKEGFNPVVTHRDYGLGV
ncbi:MAG: RNase adapter RapZ [Acidobacteriota bacterium]